MIHPVAGRSRRCALALAICSGCGDDEPTGAADPVYYAVVYGLVQQDGAPATGIEVQAEVYLGGCPPAGIPTSATATRTGAGGSYRLLLASADPAAGQCLRLGVAGATPVVQTLVDTPFAADAPADVRDSVRIDLVLP